MLNQLIDWSLRQRLLVVIILLVVVAAAVAMIPKLNLDAFPDVTNVQVSVNTQAPGLAAEEVEQLITYPIEAVMYALPDVEQVRSISKTGLSGVTIVFKEGTNIYFARQLVFERLQAAKSLIPNGVGTPEMGPNTSGLGQVYQYRLVAAPNSDYDAMALRSLNDWVVKLLIMPIDGVTDVLSFGGSVRQYQVNVDPNKLLAYGLTQQQVTSAIESNNLNAGGWYLQRGQEQLVIRGTGWFQSGERGVDEISAVPVKTIDGRVITVAEVAQVQIGEEIRQGAVTLSLRGNDGKTQQLGEVVTGIVLKRIGANTKATIDGLKKRMTLINQALPDGVTFQPFYDQADLIEQAVMTVVQALALAFLLIILIVILFLLNLTATLLVLLSIPLAITIALMVMSMVGISANLMSLGGLAVAIGMLVDGSVVMVENIVKSLSATQSTAEQQSRYSQIESTTQRISAACKEVAKPVFFASSIILLVFTPLFSFEGVEAKLFQPMALSIMLAVIAAMMVTFIVVPALAVILFKRGITPRQNPWLLAISTHYEGVLNWLLGHRKWVICSALMLTIGAGSLLDKIGTEFVPELEEGTINLRVTLAPSASLDTALTVAPKLESLLLEFPEVTYALSRIGRAEIGGDPEPVNNIEIYIGLKPVAEWQSADNRKALQQLMEQKLAVYPGLLLNFSQPIATRVDELLSGVKAQLAIKLFGKDLDVLAKKSQEIAAVVQQVAGTTAVQAEQIAGELQLLVKPKREVLSRYGLSVAEVMEVVSAGVGGEIAGQIINGNERVDIYVRLANSYRNNQSAIEDIRIQSQTGAWLRLGDVADVSYQTGPPQIRRDDVQRRVVIQANVQGRDMGSVVAEIESRIAAEVNLPAGYGIEIGGQFESQLRAQKRLLFVVPAALFLITLLLYLAFSSVKQVLLILVNIPLAIVGGVLSLYLSGQYLSVPSAVGFITLFGVAVLNGVVLVESINQRIAQGQKMQQAVISGASSRLRPVLITALTSALGLIPMLLATGVGAEIQKPLASVIVGGLFTSTLLTLLILPSLYPLFAPQTVRPSKVA
ncbi:efflux RND transporter permease subunit (plasmid) [Pseudoalteromonas sp. T1lg65]|uniref:efflux RND transporter permease subunit n=1 Tax=Pseudoalteromonas sp. T1lg65 TaxID=2077101 RepID=UPI003F7A6DEF